MMIVINDVVRLYLNVYQDTQLILLQHYGDLIMVSGFLC